MDELKVESRKKTESNSEGEEEDCLWEWSVKNVDDAYDKIRGNGRFTFYYAAIIGLIYVWTPVYVIPFMKQIPEMEWTNNGGISWTTWSKEFLWKERQSLSYR